MFKLDGRLSVCADFVREGAKLADIGTDHAYLPVYLAANGKISSAVAADVRPMPLERGRENIEKYGVQNIVSARLSNGLNEISPEEADDIVIAGMGAELISDILENAPWVKNPDKHLILQPMTRAHILRKYLSDNSFEIICEKACEHGGKIYTVILAVYNKNSSTLSETECYIGKLNMCDEQSRQFAQQVLKKLEYKRKGKLCSGESTQALDNVITEIKAKTEKRCTYD